MRPGDGSPSAGQEGSLLEPLPVGMIARTHPVSIPCEKVISEWSPPTQPIAKGRSSSEFPTYSRTATKVSRESWTSYTTICGQVRGFDSVAQLLAHSCTYYVACEQVATGMRPWLCPRRVLREPWRVNYLFSVRSMNSRPSGSVRALRRMSEEDDDPSLLRGDVTPSPPRLLRLEARPSLSLIAVAPHSAVSKPLEILMVSLDARASAGANSESIQSPAVIPALCLPERLGVETWLETESQTANEPSLMPIASWPARDQHADVGSNDLESALRRMNAHAVTPQRESKRLAGARIPAEECAWGLGKRVSQHALAGLGREDVELCVGVDEGKLLCLGRPGVPQRLEPRVHGALIGIHAKELRGCADLEWLAR
eukprot:scaffold195648_cov26-Tisochrysis_lutea.AAC.1